MQSEATTGLGVVAEGRQDWRWGPEEGSRDVYRLNPPDPVASLEVEDEGDRGVQDDRRPCG